MAVQQDTDPINRQAPMLTISVTHKPLDEAAIEKFKTLLSIPFDPLVLKVLDLEHSLLIFDNCI